MPAWTTQEGLEDEWWGGGVWHIMKFINLEVGWELREDSPPHNCILALVGLPLVFR